MTVLMCMLADPNAILGTPFATWNADMAAFELRPVPRQLIKYWLSGATYQDFARYRFVYDAYRKKSEYRNDPNR